MQILTTNAYIKHLEFILNYIDTANGSKTIDQLRTDFFDHFGASLPHLLSQHFGIIRLLPLLFIREELKNKNIEYDQTISIIRHALAHNNFSASDSGYEFVCNKGQIKMSYDEFTAFVWKIENDYYKKQQVTP